MAGFIELIAKIKPKNNGKYPLVDDVDVEMEDGSRLSEAIKKPRIPDGGTEGQILAKKSDKNGDAEWIEPLKTEDIDKKLESKLDKNLGSENSDKVLITDAEGNIITQNKEDFEGGGGTTDYNDLENKPQINGVELTGNKTSGDLKMYTQEEVDDLLYDKMDKPYKPITITDDITIEDCLDGYFKIDKIKGNTYQAEESDIVPTPQRPIPINSRKTTITKINPNIFDLEKESDTSNIPDSGTYRSIGQYQLKANTKYIFEWSEATVPAKATLSFQVQDDKGTVLVSPFTYFNIQADEKKEAGKEVEFTTNESGIIKFAYNCIVGTSNTIETYQQYWYTKILKDISLKEDVEYESECMELRSLKETGNIWDLKPFTDTNNTYYQSNDVEANCWGKQLVTGLISILKPNTTYSARVTVEMVEKVADEGFTQNSLHKRIYLFRQQTDDLSQIAISIIDCQTELNNGDTATVTYTFTTPSDLTNVNILFYTERYTNVEGIAKNSTVKFKDITLVEGSTVPQTYIPPTIRDYKIVDHATQTSKIIRNIGVVNLTNLTWTYGDRDLNHIRCYAISPSPLKVVEQYCYCNVFENIYSSKYDYSKEAIYLGNNMGGKTISIIANQDVFAGQTQEQFDRLLKEYINNPNAITLYALETPTEETIAYSADDVSEIGYSWQDTTCPSPTIKSEVKGVEKIDILKTGKNLFDVEYVSNLENWTNSNTDGYFYIPIKVPKGKQLCLSNDKTIAGGRGYYANMSPYKDKNAENYYFFYHNKSGSAYGKFDKLTKDEVIYLRINSIANNLPLFIEDFKHLQLEVGDTATAYEPYQATTISCELTTPLRGIGDVTDIIDIENDVIQRNIGVVEFDGSGDEDWCYDNINYNITTRFYGMLGTATDGNHSINHNYKTMCDRFVIKPGDVVDEEYFRLSCGHENKQYYFVYLKKSRLNELDVAAFKTWLASNPITVWYELIEPTTEPLPEDLAKLKSLKTEQGVNNIFINGEVKPTIEARYALDIASIVSKLQTKLLTLQEEVIKNV